ncbi:LysR family transcriptional regulator [Vibrio sp. E150_011]
MIKPDLLKCFIAAADTGSFSAAGRLLGKHLATISGNIARLEDELGVLLFDRNGKYPQLTEAGLHLYDGAKAAVDSIERFDRNAQHLAAGLPASFTIAIDEDIGLAPFAAVFGALQQQWPALNLTIQTLGVQKILNLVREHKIDLALTPTTEANSQFYEFRAIGHCPIDIICSEVHPLAKKRNITSDDLIVHPQIISSSAQENDFLRHSFKMSPATCECNGQANVVALIQAGLGWGLIHRLTQMPPRVVILMPDFVQTNILMQYDVIWPKNQSATDIHHFLLDQIRRVFPVSTSHKE